MSTNPNPGSKPLSELTPGEHIISGGGACKVAHAMPYQDGDGHRRVAVTLIPLSGGRPWVRWGSPNEAADIATDAEVAAHAESGRRAALAKALHDLADAIVEHALPVPYYTFSVGGAMRSRADLEAWAHHLGVEIEAGGTDGDIPVADKGTELPGGPTLSIRFQSPREPKPEPKPLSLDNAIAAAEALESKPTGELAPCGCHIFYIPTQNKTEVVHDTDCPGRFAAEPAAPKHHHAGGSGGALGQCSAECACGVTFDGFDTIAEANALLDLHIADMAPAADVPTQRAGE